MGRNIRMQKMRKRRVRQAARQKKGDEMKVARDGNNKRYDVEMIRDFLDQLLLEVRVRYHVGLKVLSRFRSGRGGRELWKDENAIAWMNRINRYIDKYATLLVEGGVVIGKNVSREKLKEVTERFLLRETEQRDEQIGYLESLKELFDEALRCAAQTLKVDSDGNLVGPTREHIVDNSIDQLDESDFSTTD